MFEQRVRGTSSLQASAGTDSDRALFSLLSRIEQTKEEQYEEAVGSIDFLHSSRKPCSTTNTKLTGRSGRSFCLCPVSQLVKNEAHKTESRKAIKFVNKQLSSLWKVPTTQGNSIAGPFRPEEFTVAPRCLKPRKCLDLSSIFLEFMFRSGSTLKTWCCDFIISCLWKLKIPKIRRRALTVAMMWDPKRATGGFGGLSPAQIKLQSPPNWNTNHYTSVKFFSTFRMSSPSLKTFWRRFWCCGVFCNRFVVTYRR